MQIQFDGEPQYPDQREELTGGPESGVPCDRCNSVTTVCGSRSMWDIYNQPGVEVVNLADISESRQKELKDMRVVILVCPQCKLKTQWLEEFLPKRMGHD